MSVPEVTVISVFHNRAAFVEASLESLASQTADGAVYHVYDDGSTDNTLAKLKQFEGRTGFRIFSLPNQGFVRTLRHACSLANTPYIAIHASGDLSVSNRLELQLQYMRQNPECVLVGGLVRYVYPDGTSRTPAVDPRRLRSPQIYVAGSPFDHSTFLFRSSAYNDVGGYRTIFKFAQDCDLVHRLRRVGKIFVLGDVLVESRAYQLQGGVRSSPVRRILQKYYVDLAHQASREVDAGRADFIDLWGVDAPFFRARSSFLRRRFFWASINAFRRGEYEVAEQNMKCCRREAGFIDGVFVNLLCYLLRVLVWVRPSRNPPRPKI